MLFRTGTFEAAEKSEIGNDRFTKLLLHMDDYPNVYTFTDSSYNHYTIQNGETGTAVMNLNGNPKFGVSCAYFSQSTKTYLLTPSSSDFDLSSHDFCIDTWMQMIATSGTPCFFAIYNRLMLSYNFTTASFVLSYALSPSVVYTNTVSYSYTLTSNTWYHIAVSRVNGQLRFFVNGIQQGNTVSASSFTYDPSNVLCIGAEWTYASSPKLYGYLDEFRFSKYTGRWTVNFTPPSAAY